ncbi:hypothetical protein AGMMS50293_29300 [Spirochaetia bacterium]|nr:hypothetical protein AGMMS50293_29300 [Spirochaetia bacterium]
MSLLVIIPTYNEIGTIERLIETLVTYIPPDAEILVVDDNSPDGTALTVEKIAADYSGRLYLLKRSEKQGLAAAYLAGFSWGFTGKYDVFLEMDADFSHDPKYIPKMMEKMQTHDVVIGSRNIKGGGVEGWSILRTIISKGGSMYSRLILDCPLYDFTGGFNMWRKTSLEKINLSSIISKGYSFQIEMKYKAYCAGCSIVEIPILFTDRQCGKSKMSKRIFFEALINIWEIRRTSKHGLEEFVKFTVTGSLGAVTNLGIFFIAADLIGFHEIPVSIICFLTAVTQNYVVNHYWSFRKKTINTGLTLKKWIFFTGASIFGLAINLFVMNTVLTYWNPPYKVIAQGIGIATGMLVNFIVSKLFIFRGTNQ